MPSVRHRRQTQIDSNISAKYQKHTSHHVSNKLFLEEGPINNLCLFVAISSFALRPFRNRKNWTLVAKKPRLENVSNILAKKIGFPIIVNISFRRDCQAHKALCKRKRLQFAGLPSLQKKREIIAL